MAPDLEVGSFYCVLSDSEQGFQIVQCNVLVEAGFAGVCLEKCLADTSDKHYYRESSQAQMFDADNVQSMLISVCLELGKP